MELIINSELSQRIEDIDFSGSPAADSELVKAILLLAHPVGSYYWSSDSTNPHDIFGGTWTQIKDKFIIAVGDNHTAGTSYGSNTKDISHTHSYAHTHGIPGVAHTHPLSDKGYADIALYTSGYLTYKEITAPTRTDNYKLTVGGTGSNTNTDGVKWGAALGGSTDSATPSATTTNSQSTSTSGSGGSTSLDITPACVAAYCWRRTA